MKSALYIGRFQPFHRGHLAVIKQILKDNDRVIIVIGSAEKNYISNNPLTAGERHTLIDDALKEAKINAAKYCIIPVRNVNNYALWVNHVNSYVPSYDRLYTGSKIVKVCYENSDIKIIKLNRSLVPISATEIREAMLKDNDWQSLVPPSVAKTLTEWKIPDRVKNINDTMDLSKYNNSY